MSNTYSFDSIKRLADTYSISCRSSGLSLKKACADDSPLYYSWINTPEYSAMSGRSGLVSWEQHSFIFSRNIRSKNHLLLKLSSAHEAYGQITFSRVSSGWSLGYHLDPPFRNRGLGRKLVVMGMAYLFETSIYSAEPLIAKVKTDNHASTYLLNSLGFVVIRADLDNNFTHFWFCPDTV